MSAGIKLTESSWESSHALTGTVRLEYISPCSDMSDWALALPPQKTANPWVGYLHGHEAGGGHDTPLADHPAVLWMENILLNKFFCKTEV